jgi:hypothetical protein
LNTTSYTDIFITFTPPSTLTFINITAELGSGTSGTVFTKNWRLVKTTLPNTKILSNLSLPNGTFQTYDLLYGPSSTSLIEVLSLKADASSLSNSTGIITTTNYFTGFPIDLPVFTIKFGSSFVNGDGYQTLTFPSTSWLQYNVANSNPSSLCTLTVSTMFGTATEVKLRVNAPGSTLDTMLSFTSLSTTVYTDISISFTAPTVALGPTLLIIIQGVLTNGTGTVFTKNWRLTKTNLPNSQVLANLTVPNGTVKALDLLYGASSTSLITALSLKADAASISNLTGVTMTPNYFTGFPIDLPVWISNNGSSYTNGTGYQTLTFPSTSWLSLTLVNSNPSNLCTITVNAMLGTSTYLRIRLVGGGLDAWQYFSTTLSTTVYTDISVNFTPPSVAAAPNLAIIIEANPSSGTVFTKNWRLVKTNLPNSQVLANLTVPNGTVKTSDLLWGIINIFS